MGAIDTIRNTLAGMVWWALGGDKYDTGYSERATWVAGMLDYYEGNHPKSLKIGKDRKDFNVTVNLISLVVDRSVSMLFGKGVDFVVEDEAAQEYVDAVWEANKKQIFLQDVGQYGSWSGTPFIKIVPGDTPRLITLNPINVTVQANPHDIERIESYVIRYTSGDTAYREITRRNYVEGFDPEAVMEWPETFWIVEMQKSDRDTGGRWQTLSETVWEYPFPPIIHAKNLPKAGSVYGRSDIEDVINLQNEYNTGLSNMNKVLWYHGHPRMWSKGRVGNLVEWGPEKILEITADNGGLFSLEMSGDMKAFREFIGDLRRDLMDISATTDIETIKDKAGSLTNFGLRVLFKDELAKLETKRLLYGEMLNEVNRRLLMLNNQDPATVVGVEWGEVLPQNEIEETNAIKADLEMGLVSKETARRKRGYEEDEAEKIAAERTQAGNVGGTILTEFLRGRGDNNNV